MRASDSKTSRQHTFFANEFEDKVIEMRELYQSKISGDGKIDTTEEGNNNNNTNQGEAETFPFFVPVKENKVVEFPPI